MASIRYCRNCYKPVPASREGNNEFCCDECEKQYKFRHNSTDVKSCDRCGGTDKEVHEYAVGDSKVTLCNDCASKMQGIVTDTVNEFTGMENFELAAKHIIMGLHDLGFDTDWDNFHDTPKRFARAYCEIFSGCKDTDAQVKHILSTSFPSQGSENMVVAKDIVCFSACPHHLLPVEYHVCVGYIPKEGGNVLGISKLARLVNVLAKRPALQETFTQEICDALDSVGALGSIALVEGQHMCMRMRGAKATNTSITTTSVSGYFKDNPSTKQEFLNNVSDRLKFRG